MDNKSIYPPTQPAYYSSQPGYPPSQPGYPPSQPGYPQPQAGFAQPQAGYPPNVHQPGFQAPPNYNQATGAATVIVTQGSTPVGPDPSQMVCPSCHATILTNIKYEPNTKTHIMALILCCFICWPCVCLPYCMDSCQSANHYCPNCQAYLGSYGNDGC